MTRENEELAEAKVMQLREQEQKKLEKNAKELKEKLTKIEERISKQREEVIAKKEMAKKFAQITKNIRLGNVLRQQKKDKYKARLVNNYRKQQDEKIEKIFEIRNTLRTQGYFFI